MMDKAQEAEESLRQATREAHEAIQDLRTIIKEAKEVIQDIRDAAGKEVSERLDPVIREHIKILGETTEAAMRESVEKVTGEFDKLSDILMGRTKKNVKRGEKSIPDLIEGK